MYEELVELLRMRAALIDSDLDNQAEETLDFCIYGERKESNE